EPKTGRRRVDHDQVEARTIAFVALLLEMPDHAQRDQLAPTGRRGHHLPERAVLEHAPHQPAQPDLKAEVLRERLVGIDAHREEPGPELANRAAERRWVAAEPRQDVLERPELV